MISCIAEKRESLLFRSISALSSITFLFSLVISPISVYAQPKPKTILNLPVPGSMVLKSEGYVPAFIKGLKVHPENPLRFDFIVDTGDSNLGGKELTGESNKLIRYFLAALTVPDTDMWVNLSPYESDRIIPGKFGETEMGRDLLAEDYLLKQLMASMIYPEDGLGKEFWKRVYDRAQKEYGTTNIPINTFNKVWIVPEDATVLEYQGSAFVVKSHLKVMLEEDYVTMSKNMDNKALGTNTISEDYVKSLSGVSSKIVKEILIPEIEKEVNTGKNFANLRQIFNSVILAKWYKENLRNSLLNQVYADKNKIKGVDVDDKEIKQKIYEQYLEAFKTGVYNYIKKDYDPATQKTIPRKYFSGGVNLVSSSPTVVRVSSPAQIPAVYKQELELSSPVANVVVLTTDIAENTNPSNVYVYKKQSSPVEIIGTMFREIEQGSKYEDLRSMARYARQSYEVMSAWTAFWARTSGMDEEKVRFDIERNEYLELAQILQNIMQLRRNGEVHPDKVDLRASVNDTRESPQVNIVGRSPRVLAWPQKIDPLQIGHLWMALKGIEELKSDKFLPTVDNGDYRKEGLLTLAIREAMGNIIFKRYFGDYYQQVPLPKELPVLYSADGERTIFYILAENANQPIDMDYGAGSDHGKLFEFRKKSLTASEFEEVFNNYHIFVGQESKQIVQKELQRKGYMGSDGKFVGEKFEGLIQQLINKGYLVTQDGKVLPNKEKFRDYEVDGYPEDLPMEILGELGLDTESLRMFVYQAFFEPDVPMKLVDHMVKGTAGFGRRKETQTVHVIFSERKGYIIPNGRLNEYEKKLARILNALQVDKKIILHDIQPPDLRSIKQPIDASSTNIRRDHYYWLVPFETLQMLHAFKTGGYEVDKDEQVAAGSAFFNQLVEKLLPAATLSDERTKALVSIKAALETLTGWGLDAFDRLVMQQIRESSQELEMRGDSAPRSLKEKNQWLNQVRALIFERAREMAEKAVNNPLPIRQQDEGIFIEMLENNEISLPAAVQDYFSQRKVDGKNMEPSIIAQELGVSAKLIEAVLRVSSPAQSSPAGTEEKFKFFEELLAGKKAADITIRRESREVGTNALIISFNLGEREFELSAKSSLDKNDRSGVYELSEKGSTIDTLMSRDDISSLETAERIYVVLSKMRAQYSPKRLPMREPLTGEGWKAGKTTIQMAGKTYGLSGEVIPTKGTVIYYVESPRPGAKIMTLVVTESEGSKIIPLTPEQVLEKVMSSPGSLSTGNGWIEGKPLKVPDGVVSFLKVRDPNTGVFGYSAEFPGREVHLWTSKDLTPEAAWMEMLSFPGQEATAKSSPAQANVLSRAEELLKVLGEFKRLQSQFPGMSPAAVVELAAQGIKMSAIDAAKELAALAPQLAASGTTIEVADFASRVKAAQVVVSNQTGKVGEEYKVTLAETTESLEAASSPAVKVSRNGWDENGEAIVPIGSQLSAYMKRKPWLKDTFLYSATWGIGSSKNIVAGVLTPAEAWRAMGSNVDAFSSPLTQEATSKSSPADNVYVSIDQVDVNNKTMLVRPDINSPAEGGHIDIANPHKRVVESAKTLKELAERNAKVVVIFHQGRPGDADFMDTPFEHAKQLEGLVGRPVKAVNDLFGQEAVDAIRNLKPGEILVLKPVRSIDPATGKTLEQNHGFISTLEPLMDFFVLDGFSVAHRDSPSVTGFKKLPTLAGKLMQSEIEGAARLLNPPNPHLVIVGGGKVAEKFIEMSDTLKSGKADQVVVGGRLANLVLIAAQPQADEAKTEEAIYNLALATVGQPAADDLKKEGLSLLPDLVGLVSQYREKMEIPTDMVYLDSRGERKVVQLINGRVPAGFNYLLSGIGPETAKRYAQVAGRTENPFASAFVIGPLSDSRYSVFDTETKEVLGSVAKNISFWSTGGGDTESLIKKLGFTPSYSSLAGGALAEYKTGKVLPGIKLLTDNKPTAQSSPAVVLNEANVVEQIQKVMSLSQDQTVALVVNDSFLASNGAVVSMLKSARPNIIIFKGPAVVVEEFLARGGKAIGVPRETLEAVGINDVPENGILDPKKEDEALNAKIAKITVLPGERNAQLAAAFADLKAAIGGVKIGKMVSLNRKVFNKDDAYINFHVIDLILKNKETGDTYLLTTYNNSPVVTDEWEVVGIGQETRFVWGQKLSEAGAVVVIGSEKGLEPVLDNKPAGQIRLVTDGTNIQVNEQLAKAEIWKPTVQSSPAGVDLTAPVTAQSSPGGIDLNPAMLNLQIKRDKNWVPLPMPEQPPLDQMNIEGFYPVIINVTPIPSLPVFLGLEKGPASTSDTDEDLSFLFQSPAEPKARFEWEEVYS